MIRRYNESLAFVASVEMPDLSDDCTSGVLDLDRGQGFFSFYDSSTALVLSVNLPQRLTPTYSPVLANNPQMVGSCILFTTHLSPYLFFNILEPFSYFILNQCFLDLVDISPQNRSLFLVSNSQVILVTYTSSCPEDCNNHGVCDYGISLSCY